MDPADATVDWFDPDVTTFGDRLAGAREAVGMTQSTLARRLGIKVATLRSWEEDRSEPRANRVQMLSGLLNVSLVWLMTGEGEGATFIPEEDGELLRQIGEVRRDVLQLSERLSDLESKLRIRLGA